MTRPGEDDIVARYFRPLATDPGALGLVDDCAALAPPPGCDLVLKSDAVASGVHFFPDDPWDMVAKKALRVNVSDLAAKGARPLGWMLTLALPADWREEDLAALSRGFAEDQATFGLSLFGGDTIRSPDGLVLSITVFGAVPAGGMVRRAAARVGDVVCVSGTLGDSALGLLARLDPARADGWGLDEAERAHVARRYLLPEPRLVLAPLLREHDAAAMDVSDGLGLDLGRMIRGSGVAARLDLDRLPLSPAARKAVAADSSLRGRIATGGDDYEILAAVPEHRFADFAAAAEAVGVAMAAIGRIEAGPKGRLAVFDGGLPVTLAGDGYRHF